MDCYERAFLDAILIIKQYILKYKGNWRKVLEIIEEIELSVEEKRLQVLREELMILS